ncbi:hypothetical protein EAE96_010838 [Botrytis aclada]|nr:hypothetical protein EAE96_010838 [Botrytis aclada]
MICTGPRMGRLQCLGNHSMMFQITTSIKCVFCLSKRSMVEIRSLFQYNNFFIHIVDGNASTTATPNALWESDPKCKSRRQLDLHFEGSTSLEHLDSSEDGSTSDRG